MPLTIKQFNKLATKDDLEDLRKEMATKEDINKILNVVDGLAKNVNDFQAELASNITAHDRMTKNFESLEKRVIKLEIKAGIKIAK
jgi:hypothetical protein